MIMILHELGPLSAVAFFPRTEKFKSINSIEVINNLMNTH